MCVCFLLQNEPIDKIFMISSHLRISCKYSRLSNDILYIILSRILTKHKWQKSKSSNQLWSETRHSCRELRYGKVTSAVPWITSSDINPYKVSCTHAHFLPVKTIYKITSYYITIWPLTRWVSTKPSAVGHLFMHLYVP